MRVHELAKELKMTSKELLELLEKQGIEVKGHMSRLEDEAVARLKQKKPQDAKPPKKVQAAPPAKPVAKKPAPAKLIEAPPKPPVEPKEPAPVLEETPKSVEVGEAIVATPQSVATAVAEAIRIEFPITVGALATKINLKVSEIIKNLMGLGVFANVNQNLSEEVVKRLAGQLGIPVEKASGEEVKGRRETRRAADRGQNAKPRPPVVTLMGHVDHGKTSLLDAIRKTNVAAREAGRITQHIGAYVVDIPSKGRVTFLDTPGHEAFTAMRARGANVTDIVVLVVAADDGVMPQTVEAIDHAKEAGVPIVVAVNKCDLPQANHQKVMVQLQKIGLVAEEWGGKTIFCKVSAKTVEGIDNLLEMLLLEAEVLELKANPDGFAEGTVIESKLTKGSGPVATVIIQRGTLRVGDIVIAGPYYGKVRALQNDVGKRVRDVTPGLAAEVHGLNGIPEAGEMLKVVEGEREARGIAERRGFELRERGGRGSTKHLSLEDLHAKIQEGRVKELKLIIKADVQGSVEALGQSLERLSNEGVRLHVIHGGVGAPNESDVMLAAASDAVIIGFHVRPEPRAEQLAVEEGVDIRCYDIIYEAVEDVRKAMEGLLEPIVQEVFEGRAEVRKVFRTSKAGTIGGGALLKGKITRSSKVRLLRKQSVAYEGRLSSLKRFKDDVREVSEGYEFGFALDGFQDLQEGDLLEAYRLEKGAGSKSK